MSKELSVKDETELKSSLSTDTNVDTDDDTSVETETKNDDSSNDLESTYSLYDYIKGTSGRNIPNNIIRIMTLDENKLKDNILYVLQSMFEYSDTPFYQPTIPKSRRNYVNEEEDTNEEPYIILKEKGEDMHVQTERTVIGKFKPEVIDTNITDVKNIEHLYSFFIHFLIGHRDEKFKNTGAFKTAINLITKAAGFIGKNFINNFKYQLFPNLLQRKALINIYNQLFKIIKDESKGTLTTVTDFRHDFQKYVSNNLHKLINEDNYDLPSAVPIHIMTLYCTRGYRANYDPNSETNKNKLSHKFKNIFKYRDDIFTMLKSKLEENLNTIDSLKSNRKYVIKYNLKKIQRKNKIVYFSGFDVILNLYSGARIKPISLSNDSTNDSTNDSANDSANDKVNDEVNAITESTSSNVPPIVSAPTLIPNEQSLTEEQPSITESEPNVIPEQNETQPQPPQQPSEPTDSLSTDFAETLKGKSSIEIIYITYDYLQKVKAELMSKSDRLQQETQETQEAASNTNGVITAIGKNLVYIYELMFGRNNIIINNMSYGQRIFANVDEYYVINLNTKFNGEGMTIGDYYNLFKEVVSLYKRYNKLDTIPLEFNIPYISAIVQNNRITGIISDNNQSNINLTYNAERKRIINELINKGFLKITSETPLVDPISNQPLFDQFGQRAISYCYSYQGIPVSEKEVNDMIFNYINRRFLTQSRSLFSAIDLEQVKLKSTINNKINRSKLITRRRGVSNVPKPIESVNVKTSMLSSNDNKTMLSPYLRAYRR